MGNWDDYVYSNGVLKNKFGITVQDELTNVENKIVVYRLAQLISKEVTIDGNFNSKYLQNIHYFLFKDLYDFAGLYREVDIFKTTGFLNYEKIPEELENLITNMNQIQVINSKFMIADYLANYYYKLIEIHPFREGNGRSIREFIRELTSYKFPEYELDYSLVDKRNFLDGVIYHSSYPSLLTGEIYNALTEVKTKVK